MKLADFYAYTEQTFDSFCKQVIRNERTDALREMAYLQRTRRCFRHLHLWRWRGCPWLIVSPKIR